MGLAEQALRDQSGAESLGAALDGGAQSGTTGADHHHIVFDRLYFVDVQLLSPRC
jgi:hypothetical protein